MPDASIALLHGDMDMRKNNERIRRVLWAFGALTLAAGALIGASLVWRDATHMHNPNETASQLVTIAVTLVWGALILFFWGMKLTPLLCYRRYLKEIQRGLSREVSGVVVRFDETTTFRDGLRFYALVVNIGDLANPEDERLLYWDARLTRPLWSAGDSVRLLAHGNDIIGL